jgi:signal transduction histidine kinase
MKAQVQRWRRNCAAALGVLLLTLALTCGITSSSWIDTPFPGFLIMANRVIASVSLPSWSTVHFDKIYQHQVIKVNGAPVTTSGEMYTAVRRLPPGAPVTYTLEKNGRQLQATIPTQTFQLKDYLLLFGSYLVSGLAVALSGLVVWWLKPDAPASQALCAFGIATGVFALTGMDLYGPHWFFRLHVLGEIFFPAGLLHLALVFPVDRVRRRRDIILSLPYIVAGGLGVVYELVLYRPGAYSFLHNLGTFYGGASAFALFSSVVWAYRTTDSPLIRQRVRVVLLGFLCGFALPAFLMLTSSLTGGEVSMNYAGLTTMLFPLSLGYAIVKHDLFEIDAMLRRSAYYLTLTVTLALAYLSFLTVLNWSFRFSQAAHSPLFPLLFTLGTALLLNPLKDYLQRGVDRVFFRLRYNPKKVLETTSAALTSTLQLDAILGLIWCTLQETMGVTQGGILLLTPDKQRFVPVYPSIHGLPICSHEHPLIHMAYEKKGRSFSLYDWEETMLPANPHTPFINGSAGIFGQLFVPLFLKGELLGLIILRRKESGKFFSAEDIEFLSTLANQSTLSIANALSYQEIHDLNMALEKKVEERTRALANANSDLQGSLEQLERAYSDLQRSKENLVRAEKMADLGRLTAGIAHEMNTPLGASLTALGLMKNLVREYYASIGDASVSEHDHREIAAELEQLVDSTQQWTNKAAAHIRSLKLHTRDLHRGEERRFSVLQTIEDTHLLLSHRFRFSQCNLTVSSTVEDPMLHGDPGKLGQVLTNLICNAIDAYKDAGRVGGEIAITVSEGGTELIIQVEDHGCGIPPENLERVFDELFSTKPLGEGTGLGLPIARNIMTNFFGGNIWVESVPGQGSVFILRFPRRLQEQTPGRVDAQASGEQSASLPLRITSMQDQGKW